MSRIQHRSWLDRRNKTNTWERIFAERWAAENEPNRGYGNGYGILQNLLILGDRYSFGFPAVPIAVVTPRDAMIAATVVQWFGTNCGHAWLAETLKQCGYKVETTERFNAIRDEQVSRAFQLPAGVSVDDLRRWEGRRIHIHAHSQEDYRRLQALREEGFIVAVGSLDYTAAGITGTLRSRLTLKGREYIKATENRQRALYEHVRENRVARYRKRSSASRASA